MAEPAWVLRARRTRARPRAIDTIQSSVSRRAHPIDRMYRVWLVWLSLLIDRLLGPSSSSTIRRARQSARAARAILEGVASSASEARQDGSARRWRRALPLRQFPLRYAAHVVTAMIVGTIALVSGDAAAWAITMRSGGAAAQAARAPEFADLRIARVIPIEEQPALDYASDLDTPALRAIEPQALPVFVATHRLAEGETLAAVAASYGVSVASLFWANDLQRGGILAAGQELRIPRISGVPHVIQEGESLDSIALQYGVEPQAIVLLKANAIRDDAPLPVGREIFIPGGTLPDSGESGGAYPGDETIAALRAVVAGVVHESKTNLRSGPSRDYPRLEYLEAGRRVQAIARHGEWIKVDTGASGIGWVRADLIDLDAALRDALPETNDFPPPPPRWVWPTQGEITSLFGWRRIPFRSFHDGLDIANDAWTPIMAASGGQVIEAGWCSGFGYCVKIDHGEGITTIYGHLIKRPPVSVGDVVAAGDLIGYMGSSYDRSGGGYSTGVHLHFTIKVNDKAVNPMTFLP